MRREMIPGVVALGIGLLLFGSAVQYAVQAQRVCEANWSKVQQSSCWGNIGTCIVFFLGTFASLGGAAMCVSQSKVSMGVAGALLGIAAWAFGMASDSWVNASVHSLQKDLLYSDEASLTFTGFFWLFITLIFAAAAHSASTNEEPITRKEPWMMVGALGVYSLIQTTATWYEASQPGFCGNIGYVGVGSNGGRCFGMILAGLNKFFSFALLVFAAGATLYAPTIAGAPLIQTKSDSREETPVPI